MHVAQALAARMGLQDAVFGMSKGKAARIVRGTEGDFGSVAATIQTAGPIKATPSDVQNFRNTIKESSRNLFGRSRIQGISRCPIGGPTRKKCATRRVDYGC